MAPKEIPSKQKWEQAYRNLITELTKEVELMRELLANLHQEEIALLEKNGTKWFELIEERSDRVLEIRALRIKRLDSTKVLIEIAVTLSKKELFPPEEEESCSILTQLDQLIALIDRMNLQNCRNDALFTQSKDQEQVPLRCAYPHPLHQPRTARRKTAIATYPPKE